MTSVTDVCIVFWIILLKFQKCTYNIISLSKLKVVNLFISYHVCLQNDTKWWEILTIHQKSILLRYSPSMYHIPYTSTHVQEHDYKLHEIVTNILRGSCIRYHQYIVGVSGPTHFTDINSLDDVL